MLSLWPYQIDAALSHDKRGSCGINAVVLLVILNNKFIEVSTLSSSVAVFMILDEAFSGKKEKRGFIVIAY